MLTHDTPNIVASNQFFNSLKFGFQMVVINLNDNGRTEFRTRLEFEPLCTVIIFPPS